MRITRHADYALRVLMYIALKDGEIATIGDIAEHYDISKNHLTKIVQRLNQQGFLRATRGRNGGLVLARPAAQIRVGDVFRVMETDLAVVECLKDRTACVLSPCCELRTLFDEATREFLAVLDQRSLADMVPRRKEGRMRDLLSISASE